MIEGTRKVSANTKLACSTWILETFPDIALCSLTRDTFALDILSTTFEAKKGKKRTLAVRMGRRNLLKCSRCNDLLVMYTYIHNWSLQPFDQDY